MRRALALARRGLGRTAPNPLVGAVVVRNGKVVGEGYHRGPGTPHAEIHALAAAGRAARGATLYVTLEPCGHTAKRTPPCAPEVIRSGVKRLVVGMVDPNPKVAGRGIRAIAATGIEVSVGVEDAACKALNAPYARVMERGLPWVTLKFAQTLDGKVATATGESRWITGEVARRHGHRLRDRHEAIMVGIGTVLADDPELTCRVRGGRDPLRVVVDANLATPPTARVLTPGAQAPTILACVADASIGQGKALARAGAEVLRLPARNGRVDLTALLAGLAARGVHRVLCEGGPTLAAELLRLGLVNRVACYVAPAVMGGDDARGSVAGRSPAALADRVALGPFAVRRLGKDLLLEADVLDKAPPERLER
ncbi:MAG: bifunctional diaminohydroxyphosphoribosylaminopyrimidine deaminase/5-amino-6-(5-phosphoribosylamino)uracil reductase RibD [Nitrospirae bacterium]|nr:bifunctional diaminohydroxyphosphoribosylaminopyrimidine deaminase/5-amino-6-(5-phosphoribosylamino)uracil reductase RibD [Nitrospirota bacterium]